MKKKLIVKSQRFDIIIQTVNENNRFSDYKSMASKLRLIAT